MYIHVSKFLHLFSVWILKGPRLPPLWPEHDIVEGPEKEAFGSTRGLNTMKTFENIAKAYVKSERC